MEKECSYFIILEVWIFYWRCYLYDRFTLFDLRTHQFDKKEKKRNFKSTIYFY